MQTLHEFRKSLIKNRSPKKGGRGFVGRDYYRHYRNTRTIPYKMDILLFNSILARANQELANMLLKYSVVQLPLGLGELVLKSYKPTLEYIDNKLINKLPIDWNETIKLWHTDQEAFENKTILRLDTTKQFSLKYLKHKSKYKNRCFYHFSFNRKLKKEVVKLAKVGELQTFDNNNNIWQNKQ